MTPTKEMIKNIAEHPKTSAVVLAVTGAERFWIDWGSWIVDALYSVAGLILVCVLTYKHYLSIKKDIKEYQSKNINEG